MDSRKKIIIIVTLTIFASGIILWFVLARLAKPQTDNNQQAPVEQAQKFQLKKMNQEIYSLIKKAAKENKPELCEKFILEIDRDYCLTYVFQITANVEICQKISDKQMKNDCLDLDIFKKAISEKNIDGCSAINNGDYKNQCLRLLIGEFSKIGDCAGQNGEVKSLCESSVYYKIAMREKKLELCDKITDIAYKADCEKTLKNLSPDTDKDGLTDDYEVQLGTNPFKADSDGDGMSDGEEMKARRNPLIKGK